MIVSLEKTLLLPAPLEETWGFFREVTALASMVPGVENILKKDSGAGEIYMARLVDKVGPFRVQLGLEIEVVDVKERSRLTVKLRGSDPEAKNRINGDLSAAFTLAESNQTQVYFSASTELVGKLASLGSSPIRRRAEQHFNEFARRIEARFSRPISNSHRSFQ